MTTSTTTVTHLIGVAENEVGYHESGGRNGRSGNITKYWAKLAPGLQGQPWCAAFQRWVEYKSGAPLLPIQNPYYCPNIVTYAKKNNLWDTSPPYSAGDLVLFDWTGNGVTADHIGLVTSDDGTNIHTIEGNTQATGSGYQANGGGVYNKVRPHSSTVMGVLRYSSLLSKATVAPSPTGTVIVVAPGDPGGVGVTVDWVAPPRVVIEHNPFKPPRRAIKMGVFADIVTGLTQVQWVQWVVGAPITGVWDLVTNRAVHVFQRYHGIQVTGVIDARTRTKMAATTH